MTSRTIKVLKHAIKQIHACKALYIKNMPGEEVFEDGTTWKGEVAIFKLQGHATVTR